VRASKMSVWAHCNRCLTTFAENNGKLKLFVTSCGHMFCEKCVHKKCTQPCYICNKNASIVEIGRSLPAHMRHLFTNPRDLSRNNQKTLSYVLTFQQKQRDRLSKKMLEHAKQASNAVHAMQKELMKARKLKDSMIEKRKKCDQLVRRSQTAED